MSPVAEDRADPEPDGETPAAEEAPATVPLPAAAPAPAPPVNGVRYVLTTFGVSPVEPQFMATKKVYQGGSRAEAIAFLRTQAVTEPLLYIEVETPEGLFAIDDRHRVFNESGIFVDF
jgi:hypothetical protein